MKWVNGFICRRIETSARPLEARVPQKLEKLLPSWEAFPFSRRDSEV